MENTTITKILTSTNPLELENNLQSYLNSNLQKGDILSISHSSVLLRDSIQYSVIIVIQKLNPQNDIMKKSEDIRNILNESNSFYDKSVESLMKGITKENAGRALYNTLVSRVDLSDYNLASHFVKASELCYSLLKQKLEEDNIENVLPPQLLRDKEFLKTLENYLKFLGYGD
jgi:hypothetical protein